MAAIRELSPLDAAVHFNRSSGRKTRRTCCKLSFSLLAQRPISSSRSALQGATMTLLKPLLPLTCALAFTIGCAHTAQVPAAKVDSGLGALPPYSEWQKHPELARFTAPEWRAYTGSGEKIDSGLGELPPYSEWKNHPALARLVVRPKASSERGPLALHLPD
jgi:hypothetical protein